MTTNPYTPPTADLQNDDAPKGLSHWLTIPIGFVMSYLACYIVEPVLLNLVLLPVLPAPMEKWETVFLSLDLVLSIVALVLALTVVHWLSRPSKARASFMVSLLLFSRAGIVSFSPGNSMPVWYKCAVLVTIAFGWWLSTVLYSRITRKR